MWLQSSAADGRALTTSSDSSFFPLHHAAPSAMFGYKNDDFNTA